MTLRVSLCCVAVCAPCLILTAAAQPSSSAPAGAAVQTPATSGRTGAALQPSIQLVKAALSTVNIDKWKASSAIKSEADGNLNSVQRDIDQTLPALVMAADAAPDSIAKAVPVYRNVDALYDVMLRLDAAGRLSAPKDQVGALDDALASIAKARSTLGDQLQASADAQEQRIIRLQQAAARPAPAPTPAAVQCTPPPAPTTAKKKRSTSKSSASTATKPASTATH
jgi:hypothetical protein